MRPYYLAHLPEFSCAELIKICAREGSKLLLLLLRGPSELHPDDLGMAQTLIFGL